MITKFTTQGHIHDIGETKQISEKFRVRPIVITIDADEQYPQKIPFQVTGDLCDALDNYTPGSLVTFEFTLRGNEKDGRHFVNLTIGKLQLA